MSGISKTLAKVYIGVGAAISVANAVFIRTDSESWRTYIGFILLGIAFILQGIYYIRGGTGQKVIRGLGIGFAGAAIVFFVVGFVMLRRS